MTVNNLLNKMKLLQPHIWLPRKSMLHNCIILSKHHKTLMAIQTWVYHFQKLFEYPRKILIVKFEPFQGCSSAVRFYAFTTSHVVQYIQRFNYLHRWLCLHNFACCVIDPEVLLSTLGDTIVNPYAWVFLLAIYPMSKTTHELWPNHNQLLHHRDHRTILHIHNTSY